MDSALAPYRGQIGWPRLIHGRPTIVHRRYKPGDFPVAEHAHAHAHTIKLPVWHREQDLELAEQYVRAAVKISDHHKELQ
ncbi:hypothetical protein [Streptomyces sp. Y1]|uniref:Uncharacterized protein n=1 Tax=Streptomyces sp. Y1 TaxID=3238634 RepID=A0AB39TVH9_9ACTN